MARRIATWAAIVLCQAHAGAQPQPRLPCGGELAPAYPDLSAAPIVTFWDQPGLGAHWKPPACTGWTSEGFSTLVATAARFRGPSTSAGLLRRIGAISELAGVRYWSTTLQRWQTLIVEACALAGPQAGRRRKDFTPDELMPGGVFYFEQRDNLSDKAVFRMHVAKASEDRIVFDVENESAIRYLQLTMFRPAEVQSIYLLDRDGPDVWRYYGLARTGESANSLTAGHRASAINRAVAIFRHLAGLPADLEPPAAR